MLAPVWFSAGVGLAVTAENFLESLGWLSHSMDEVLAWVSDIGQLAIPVGLLFGVLQTKLARSAVSKLVIELGQTPPALELRDALSRTLKDPSLQLVFWVPHTQQYVDLNGQPVALPYHNAERAFTVIEREGQPLAAMIHDPALVDEHELVEATRSAARLGIENERLQAEIRARLEEVRASRARIVQAADAARQRVERNLHDGAQQRLVSLSLTLRRAQDQLRHNPDPSLHTLLTQASQELKQALVELRELAHGLHPAILTQQGLGAAVTSLAEQTPFPVDVEIEAPFRRYPSLVEVTAYFVICEALVNTAKHARASRARVHVKEVGGRLIVEVNDDGVGGAAPPRRRG